MTWSASSIRPQYSRFIDSYPNLLFANHSHQAWPNVARFGQLKAFDLAAENHGAKWIEIEKTRSYLKNYISEWIGNDSFGAADGICWGQNTFELLGSFLSSLNLDKDSVIVTSDTEFHSMRRLLAAYEENGVKIVRVETYTEEELLKEEPSAGFFVRLNEQIKKVDPKKLKAIMFSSVSFHTGNLLPEFEGELSRLLTYSCPVLVDLYHHIGPKRFKLPSLGQENLYLVGGGYKYLQMGEGNCWMRAPIDSKLKPILTGWYAEMEMLSAKSTEEVIYPDNAERFRGATYDGSSVLRAKEVAGFFKDIGFDPSSLEKKYTADVSYLYERIHRLVSRLPENYKKSTGIRILSHKSQDLRAGFFSLKFRDAALLNAFLLKNFIETDYRGEIIRFGPAPYTLKTEMDRLLDVVTDFFEGEI
ncbi:MAG: hypothetical protein VX583_10295 [Bdellovibrionota bacterium]|nr:hypothetical protein [Pseudobdellovibrionaceae bacterium]|tara:strand:+ start:28583 stop:29833 length:1251 start_codon:yes stop_codon:yes gene_type:complete